MDPSVIFQEQAIKLVHSGKFKEAENILLENIIKKTSTGPGFVRACIILIDVYIGLQNFERARDIYEYLCIHPFIAGERSLAGRIFVHIPEFITQMRSRTHEYKPADIYPFFRYTNPSILSHDNRLVTIMRMVNYSRDDSLGWKCDGDIWKRSVSQSYIQVLDEYWRILKSHKAEDHSEFPKYPMHIIGHEDCRIFRYNNKYYFTATNCELYRDFKPHIVLGRLDDNLNIDRIVPLSCQNMNDCQKNWLPFVHNNEVHLIYKLSPFIINKINTETGSFEEVIRREMPHWHFPHLRGSASPIDWCGGYLFLVHYVDDTGAKYVYVTRFIWMTYDFEIKYISGTFYFEHHGIEFVSGLAMHGGEIHISYGVKDGSARVCRLSSLVLQTMLPWYNATASCFDENYKVDISKVLQEKKEEVVVVNQPTHQELVAKKVCVRCNQPKSEDEFHPKRKNWCRTCYNKYKKTGSNI